MLAEIRKKPLINFFLFIEILSEEVISMPYKSLWSEIVHLTFIG